MAGLTFCGDFAVVFVGSVRGSLFWLLEGVRRCCRTAVRFLDSSGIQCCFPNGKPHTPETGCRVDSLGSIRDLQSNLICRGLLLNAWGIGDLGFVKLWVEGGAFGTLEPCQVRRLMVRLQLQAAECLIQPLG